MPELSIIIPCYNYARYLRESVDSVLSQAYKDFELILIDDASSDETWKIMQSYASQSPQVRIFRNEKNLGIFKSNQKGWEKSRGKYLHFFSADDLYQPSCLAKVMSFFQQNPHINLICTDIGYFHDGDKEIVHKKLLEQCRSPRYFSRNEMIPLFQTTPFWVPGLTCIVKNETLKKHGHLKPRLENISDWYCFHKISLMEGVGYIPETLISMRLHDQTYTSRVKRDKKRRRAAYRCLLKELEEDKVAKEVFKQSGLLSFVFKELYWKLRFNPRYFSFWPYLKK